jgi:hypothetical protein
MKTIIAGSRDIRDYDVLKEAIAYADYGIPTEIVSGAAQGVDRLGERFAKELDVECTQFEADWDEKGKAAGPIRNKEMAEYGDCLLAIWDGQSSKTRSMIEKAHEEGIPVSVYLTEEPPENDLDKEELLYRLPEIDKMSGFYRSFTMDAFLTGCPEYFWELPTSSTGKYHPKDESGEHGNLIHTKRVFSTYEDSSRSLVQAGVIDENDQEAGMAAALLHDMLKYGYPEQEGEHTIKYHDVLGAAYIRQYTNLPEKVARLVNIHNGAWHVGPTPETQHEWLFHQCDMISARRNNNMAINGPVPEELTEASDMILEK